MNQNNRNRQLAAIIQNTSKWMDVLSHECNGLLSNIKWLSKIMQEEKETLEILPVNTFAELNQTAQKNIYTVKVIQSYCRVMKEVALVSNTEQDEVVVNEAMLFTSIKELEGKVSGLKSIDLNVSLPFARVLIFLMDRILELENHSAEVVHPIRISIEPDDPKGLIVCVSGMGLIWELDHLNDYKTSDLVQLSADITLWPLQMIIELLEIIDGRLITDYVNQNALTEVRHSTTGSAEIAKLESKTRQFAFYLPFGLGSV